MQARLFWIAVPTGRLALAPAPRGGESLREEIQSLRTRGIDHLVSLLTPAEEQDRELAEEAGLCAETGITFTSFPVEDRQVPGDRPAFARLVQSLIDELNCGRGVAVHCRLGIGRSALTVACVLARLGMPANAAYKVISSARGYEVPDTQEQRAWLTLFVQDNCS